MNFRIIGKEIKDGIRKDRDISFRGQVYLQQHLFGFAKSIALKCVMELGVVDIIKSHGDRVTNTCSD